MTQPDVLVYSHEWHLTRSSAFVDLVVEPLQPYADVVHEAWQSDTPAAPAAPVLIFCQLLPPVDWLHKQTAKLIWVPMWDAVRHQSQAWWNKLPKSLHIIAFSKAVAERARRAELPLLELQYFKNPAAFPAASWGGECVLYYWNRRGLISPVFLERFCATLKIDRMLFRPDIDPLVDQRAAYALPTRLGGAVVEPIATTASREEYWKRIAPANIVIAPRLHEGAGMVFLEALARGCAVFANNAPTMNEYIQHQQNGCLFQRGWSYQRLRAALQARLISRGIGRSTPFVHGLPERQNWEEIAALDLAKLGEQARETHLAGYARWLNSIPDFARFVLE